MFFRLPWTIRCHFFLVPESGMHLFRRKNNKNFTTFELWFGMAIHVLYFLLNQFLLLYVKTWKGVVMRSQLMNDNIIIQIRIKFFSSNKSIFVGIHVWKPGWWGFKVLIHTKVVQGLFQVNFQITIGINCIEIQCSLQKKKMSLNGQDQKHYYL